MLVKIYNFLMGKRGFKKPGSNPLLIIESDDWGSIRMKSAETLKALEKMNPQWVNDPYLQNDRLESKRDVEGLVSVLQAHRDHNGRSAIITANCISMNPAFPKIRENGFSDFIGEHFQETAFHYEGCENVFETEKAAYEEGFFYPQFHGREHIQINRWMKGLRQGNKDLLNAFDHGIISYCSGEKTTCAGFYMDAMNASDKQNLDEIIAIVKIGLDGFEQTWGFRSRSMIAPCYYWHPLMEDALVDEGIRLFQGISVQKVSYLNNQPVKFKKMRRVTGEINKNGQYYSVRNAFFEPTLNPTINWVDGCLAEIGNAFNTNGIAIISAHRLNFIGGIKVENRDKNLKMLNELLSRVKKEWPGVEFGTTDDLLNLLEQQSIEQ